MIYIGNTFSPMMVGEGLEAVVREVSLDEIRHEFIFGTPVSVVSHETTAAVLSALLGFPVKFNRVNLTLSSRDHLLCVVPNFRASEAREFTREEVEAAGFRCFWVKVRSRGRRWKK